MLKAHPITILHTKARSDWMDYNGHMNVAAYVTAFDQAMEAFLESMALGQDYTREQEGSVFVLQNNITYQREVRDGEALSVDLQLLAMDRKRLHLFLRMHNETRDHIAATSELLGIHVDMRIRRSAPFPDHARAHLAKLLEIHKDLDWPVEAGRAIRLREDNHDA